MQTIRIMCHCGAELIVAERPDDVIGYTALVDDAALQTFFDTHLHQDDVREGDTPDHFVMDYPAGRHSWAEWASAAGLANTGGTE